MNTPAAPKAGLHPIIWIAAIAVILFSLVGIAAMTGLLPGARQAEAPAQLAETPSASEPAPAEAAVPPEPAKPEPVAEKPAQKPAPVKQAAKPAAQPKEHSSYSSKPAPIDQSASYSSKPAPPPPCPDCAVITAIEPVAVEGEGTGLGAIAGGVLGAVVGNQIGKGSGRDVARIAGIAGGAYAGHQVEKSQRAGTAYDIVVRFTEDGSTTRIRENAQPVWQIGDKVRVEGGRLVPR